MKITTLTALTASSLIVLPAIAFAAVSVGETVGTTEAEVRASLESKGYIVNEIEVEENEIDVEVMFEGAEMEIEIAADTGAITEIELEDDDD